MRKTKIVCTIGPASADKDILKEMCLAGMNVARINFSHGSHAEHLSKIKMIKEVREELSLPIAILLDTKGPEYRINRFKNKKAEVKEGDRFTFTTREIVGDETCVSVNYEDIAKDLEKGDEILVCDGLMKFRVIKTTKTDVVCECVVGGVMSDKKSMSFPDKVMSHEFLSEQDKKDMLFGIKNGVDFIACSFVSEKQNIVDVKDFLKGNGGEGIDVIAKIENRAGVDNIEEICSVSDGIMIARGDLGVEIPFEELPAIQKDLITRCRMLGKRVITATEMLETMIYNVRPTRAEISDVANAVYDGTSAIMLSGETAAGKYPVLAVETMAKIAEKTEADIDYGTRYTRDDFKIKNMDDAISHATCEMASDIKADLIIVCTITGRTARMVSRFRPYADIMGMTTNEETFRKLALSWGVYPVMSEEVESREVLFYNAKKLAKEYFGLKPGQTVVTVGGTMHTHSSNLLEVDTVR